MASTRSKNTPGDYYLEQRNLELSRVYEHYAHSASGKPKDVAFPALGFNPSWMARDTLCHNPVDVESELFGINSTNLVTPHVTALPQLKTQSTIAYFETLPLIMPQGLVIENKQRPLPSWCASKVEAPAKLKRQQSWSASKVATPAKL